MRQSFNLFIINAQKLILCFSVIFIAQSCQLFYRGEGDIVIEQYPISTVESFYVDDVFDIYIVRDTASKLFIEAGENQQTTIQVTYNSEQKKLNIGNSVRFRMVQGNERIKVFLHTPTLKLIEFTVAGGLYTTDTLFTDNFKFSMRGNVGKVDATIKAQTIEIENIDTNGLFVFRGEAESCTLINKGLGAVDLSNLTCQQIVCKQYSLGDCHLRAGERLNYEIYRNGNIYQYGLIAQITGRKYGSGNFYISE